MNSDQCPELYHLHHVQVSTLTDRVAEDMCKPSQLVTLAHEPAVHMSNSTEACNHERLTWRAELSVWVLNIVCTQTKISFMLYLKKKKGVCFLFLWHVHNTHIYTCKKGKSCSYLRDADIIGLGYYYREWMDAVYPNRRKQPFWKFLEDETISAGTP